MDAMFYNYIRALQFEKTWPADVGSWGRTFFRIGYGEGWPLKIEETTFDASIPGPLPDLPKADPSSFLQTGPFLSIRSLDDAIRLPKLAIGETLNVGCYQNHSWATNSDTGDLSIPKKGEPLNRDSHGLLLVGMNKALQQFRFVNSWGEEWGDGGFGTMPFAYFEAYVFEAYTALVPGEDVFLTNVESKFGTIRISTFSKIMGIPFFFATLQIEGKTAGWAFARDTPSQFEIYELFVWPEFRRKGIATALVDSLVNTFVLRPGQNRSLHVPFSDSRLHSPETAEAVTAIAAHLNLKFVKPESNYDCYYAISEGAATQIVEPARIPGRPKSTLDALREFVAATHDEEEVTEKPDHLDRLAKINPERFMLAKKVSASTASKEEERRFKELQDEARTILRIIAPLDFDLSDLPELEARKRNYDA